MKADLTGDVVQAADLRRSDKDLGSTACLKGVLFLGLEGRGDGVRSRKPDPLYGIFSQEPPQRGRGLPGGGASDKVTLSTALVLTYSYSVELTVKDKLSLYISFF